MPTFNKFKYPDELLQAFTVESNYGDFGAEFEHKQKWD
jgi:hypothetical protein